MAAALLDDPIDGGEAESCSLAYLLGGEKRLEDAGLSLRIHPASGITDRQHGIGGRFLQTLATTVCCRPFHIIGGLNGKPTPLGHGIAGVHDQIHDGLFNLSRIGFDRPQLRIQGRDQMDILAD